MLSNKQLSEKDVPAMRGGKSGDGGGPTGSSRSYPKGKGGVSPKADFNPMTAGTTDWAVGGV